MDTLTYVEIIATISSIACVWLSVRRNILTWAVGIVGILGFLYIFVAVGLWGDASLQIVFLVQSIYGWWHWAKVQKKPIKASGALDDFTDLQTDAHASQYDHQNEGIHSLTANEGTWSLMAFCILFGGYMGILTKIGDAHSYPFLDSLATSLSLIANVWLGRKILQSWYLWLVADVVLVALCALKALYISAAMYVVFLALAAWGLMAWRREWQKLQNQ